MYANTIRAVVANHAQNCCSSMSAAQTTSHSMWRSVRGIWRPEAVGGTFTPLDLAQLYSFPAGTDGSGQTIALIELGGGYHPTELTTYFTQLGLTPPKVTSVSVDHGRNHPSGSPNGADGEVLLDIEVAGAMAPAAHMVVYFGVSGAFGEAGSSLTRYNRRFLVSLPVALYRQYRNADKPFASLAVRLPLGYHYGDRPAYWP